MRAEDLRIDSDRSADFRARPSRDGVPRCRLSLRRVRLLVGAATLALSAHVTEAQSADSPGRVGPLLPGDRAINSTRILTDSVRYQLTAFRGTSAQPLGIITDVITLGPGDGTSGMQLRRVRTIVSDATTLVDSTVSDARTLAPRSHHAWHPTRRVLIEFTGRRVKGALGPYAIPSVPIDTTFPVLPFDSGNWDLVVRSLPLVIGYRARFVVYDTDSGLREYAIHVTGSTALVGEEALVVVFSVAPGKESVVWIGKTSGRLLQIETLVNDEILLRQVRMVDR